MHSAKQTISPAKATEKIPIAALMPGELRSRRPGPDNPENAELTALVYRASDEFLGLSRAVELQSGRPDHRTCADWIDIALLQPASHRAGLACVRDGILPQMGGVPLEFPDPSRAGDLQASHSKLWILQLLYLSLVEILYGYPLDGVVLDHWLGQDHARSADGRGDREYPRNCLTGWSDAERLLPRRAPGSGTALWKALRDAMATGEIDYHGFIDLVASSGSLPAGHCNTMGTAMTMNSARGGHKA